MLEENCCKYQTIAASPQNRVFSDCGEQCQAKRMGHGGFHLRAGFIFPISWTFCGLRKAGQ
jgi:hypothetical protein